MANKLQKRFPMIRSREQILCEIQGDPYLSGEFLSWDPDVHPERLERLLSLLLRQDVKILMVLPNEGVKIAEEGSLLIMDIVVQLGDGSIANVECQKNGYAFPGQRAACYSSDLLMRQYRRVRKERADAGRKFSYRDIKNVYTIIFYEKSPAEFSAAPDCCIHRSGEDP